jgi:hypothetical protein
MYTVTHNNNVCLDYRDVIVKFNMTTCFGRPTTIFRSTRVNIYYMQCKNIYIYHIEFYNDIPVIRAYIVVLCLTVYIVVLCLTVYIVVLCLTVYVVVLCLTVYIVLLCLTVYIVVLCLTVYIVLLCLTVYTVVLCLTVHIVVLCSTVYIAPSVLNLPLCNSIFGL